MTRKALAKRLQQQNTPRPRHGHRRSGQTWMAVGALVASATLIPRAAAAADLFSPFARRDQLDHRRSAVPALDRRLAAVEDALRVSYAPQQSALARRIDIAPGPLSDVVRAFEQLTGVRVVLEPPSLGTVQSPGVTGARTPSEALAALVHGTGVRFRFTAAAQVLLEVELQSESVDVTGRATGGAIGSPKYPTTLRDTPQTIEVIPRAAMEQQGVTTLTEALRNVAGITLQAGEGGGASSTAGDMFNMRGFNAASSLFVDGVRDDGLISRDVFNLEQVEVFMGPTGSDVGRGTAAGYVNMQTKTPRLDAAASGVVMYGSGDQRRVSADVNHAFTNPGERGWWSRSAVRANLLWQDSGVPGRDVVELGTRAFAPSVGLGLDTATRVTVGAQIVRQDNLPDYGVPGAAWLDEPLTPTTVRAAATVDQTNYYGSRDYDYDHASQDSVVARVEHDLSPAATIRHQTRYNAAHREAVITSIGNVASFDPATNLVTLSRQGNERDNSILSHQTSLTSRFDTGRVQHSSSAGLELSVEKQFAPALGGVGTRAPVDIFDPHPDDVVAGYEVARTGAATRGRTATAALYVFDSVVLSPRWQATGGLRWERYDTAYRSVDTTGLATDESARDTLISGKAGLIFSVSPRGSLYLSYGSTLTPPGGINFSLSAQANNQNNSSVEPQQSTNLEAGSKWELAGGRLLVTGAVFHTRNTNVIYTVDTAAVPPIYNQDDGQRVNGITIGATGRIGSRWDVIGNAAYLDTALEAQNAATNGKRLTLTPELSGGVWTTCRLPRRVTIGGGLRLTDAVFINTANTIRKPGYRLVDLLAEYAVTPHATLRLNLYNVTDERYIRSVNNNGGRYNPGTPRAGVLTLALGF